MRLHQAGATILLSTHRMESVEELCTHIALLNHGKKVLDGRVQAIRDAHRSNQYKLVFRGDAPAAFSCQRAFTPNLLNGMPEAATKQSSSKRMHPWGAP